MTHPSDPNLPRLLLLEDRVEKTDRRLDGHHARLSSLEAVRANHGERLGHVEDAAKDLATEQLRARSEVRQVRDLALEAKRASDAALHEVKMTGVAVAKHVSDLETRSAQRHAVVVTRLEAMEERQKARDQAIEKAAKTPPKLTVRQAAVTVAVFVSVLIETLRVILGKG